MALARRHKATPALYPLTAGAAEVDICRVLCHREVLGRHGLYRRPSRQPGVSFWDRAWNCPASVNQLPGSSLSSGVVDRLVSVEVKVFPVR
jgi:hypothetical protein